MGCVVSMIKSSTMERARHVTGIAEKRNAHRVWLESLKQRGRLGDLRVSGRIILKWMLKNGVDRLGLDLSGSGYVQVVSCC